MKYFLTVIVALSSITYTRCSHCGKRVGDTYTLCPEQKNSFINEGLAILPNILTEEEMRPIEDIYMKYMEEGSPSLQGKDFCDMSKPFNTPRDEYSIINAMLPSRYYPELKNNAYEKIAKSIASQLFDDVEMVFDYDQLLDKKPGAKDAVFAWHQGYLSLIILLQIKLFLHRYGILADPSNDPRYSYCHIFFGFRHYFNSEWM